MTNQLVETVTTTFQKVLERRVVAPSDDFFACGGDSLTAIDAMEDLSAQLGRRLDIALILAHPTPERLARAIAMAS